MNYIEKNRGFITASKVKAYMKSKELYKKIYIDEVDTSIIKESPALEKGTMIDEFILSPEIFAKNYATPIGKWLKWDFEKACLNLNIPIPPKASKDELQALLFGDKEVVTYWEFEMLEGIKRELKRQPLFDFDGQYDSQKEFVVEYKWLKLKGTLDRYSFEKKLIRDLKTTKDLEYSPFYDATRFESNLINYDEYQYAFQMGWYWLLNYLHTKEKFDAILDAIKPSWNYAYEAYIYRSSTLEKIALFAIIPVLDMLVEDTKNNKFIDSDEVRKKLINDRYYPILDWSIQKELRIIEPSF